MRIRSSLHIERDPLELTLNGLRAKGIAGMISLDADCELEIMPKYAASNNTDWRQDLLFMSMFSRHGDLLLQDRIGAGTLSANDLASFAAEVLLRLFYKNRRSPLRVHRFKQFVDFALEGEVDAEDIFLPDDEGFKQVKFSYDSDNEYSATIAESVRIMHERVRDPILMSRLRRMLTDIGPVATQASIVRRTLPPRLRRWQILYDFAYDLCHGLELAPGNGPHYLPGFVISTWQTWEDLVTRALVIAFGYSAITVQRHYNLGTSTFDGKNISVNVRPDIVLVNTPCGPLIIDAKYKGRGDLRFTGISESDLYEALAFVKAVGARVALLVYPSTMPTRSRTGDCELVEEIRVNSDITVIAACIEVNGVGQRGGFAAFVDGLRRQVIEITTPKAKASHYA